MARFLATVWPVQGHFSTNLAVAIALRKRGHEVAFYTGPPSMIDAEREGFTCFPFRKLDWGRVEWLLQAIDSATTPWQQLTRARGHWREWLVETIPAQCDDLEEVLASWRPDVIICDLAMWGPPLILHETRCIPVAMLSYLAACLLPGPDAPVLGRAMSRPRAWRSRLVRRSIRAAMSLIGGAIPRAADAVRSSYGLPPLGVSVNEYTGQMPLYLMASTPEFDYARTDLPASVRYVGPCNWDRPRDEARPSFLSDLPRDRPWVYVTDGTMHFKESLVVRAVLDGLADLPIQIIATTGKGRGPADLGIRSVPPNTHVEEWVPHSDLFPMLDLVISTGGSGTTMKALMNGVPLISVPMAWDQGENAWRVVDAGAGLRIPPGRCTPARMRQAVQCILGDPSFKRHAGRLAESFTRVGGADQAAELLEALAVREAVAT